VVDPVIYFTCILITMQHLVVVSHTVCARVGPENLWDAGNLPPWDGACLTPITWFSSNSVTVPISVTVWQTIRS